MSPVTVTNPDDPVTRRQAWALFCITRYDVRETNLTKADAHDLLEIAEDDPEMVMQAVADLEGSRLVPGGRLPEPETAKKAVDPHVKNLKEGAAQAKTAEAKGEKKPAATGEWFKPRPLKITPNGSSGRLSVPKNIRDQIDPDAEFVCYLTPDGILYKPVVS